MLFINNTRQCEIISILQQLHTVSTSELAQHFHVSSQTIRRDLAQLEKQGILKKSYGNATLCAENYASKIQPIENRKISLQNVKEAIAIESLKYIPDNATIALDAGSTILELCKVLGQRENLIILTSDIYSATELLTHTEHKIYLIGGFLTDNGVTSGNYAKELLNSIASIDVFLFSTDGLTAEDGLTNDSSGINQLKKAFLKKANKKIAIVDHSKFGKKYFYKMCELNEINCLITDSDTDSELVNHIRQAGVTVETVLYPPSLS